MNKTLTDSMLFKNFPNGILITDKKLNVIYNNNSIPLIKTDYKTWTEAIKRYHSSNPNKNIKYHKKVLANWKVIEKKEDNKNNSKVKNNFLKLHVKNNQPKLYERLEKIMFFRNIFMEKTNN